jgi:hypothetical protein
VCPPPPPNPVAGVCCARQAKAAARARRAAPFAAPHPAGARWALRPAAREAGSTRPTHRTVRTNNKTIGGSRNNVKNLKLKWAFAYPKSAIIAHGMVSVQSGYLAYPTDKGSVLLAFGI